ncbi:MAG: nicotinate-nucleotide adenylyltransferase [Lachnospiraceae bacterium]|nr:nicotinate-nucleotide adenylyltransferase [Lachnospiraceae bacterium]
MAKIGIMGGTFDPIHNGHLMLGRQALEEYQLDQIWFMPSGQPPHKKDHPVTDADIRCEMVRLALLGQPGFIFSDFEIRRPGNTYTAQTLALLHQEYPQHEFYFIVGADSLYEIEGWYEPERIMSQTVILAAGREYEGIHRSLKGQMNYLKEKYGAQIEYLHCREMDISSEEIRSLTAEGQSVKALVPEAVFAYMEKNHLYQHSVLV